MKLSINQKKRLTSIVLQYSVIFGYGLFEENMDILIESNRLIEVINDSHPNDSEILKLLSIVRQKQLLFGGGMVSTDGYVHKECEQLIRVLKNLNKPKLYVGDLKYKKDKVN
ncbi:MAG: hypothetical protein KA885_00905 [Spirochaetes bacterium]|nr:hypothetical protein [Spirochaetota bacterium]